MKLKLRKKFKLRKSLHGNLKAVSPVIATIIIVAIAITMSIAVAYWLLGLGSSFTKYEKVEFTTAYADTGNTVVLNMRNTGSAAATIDAQYILYNGKPASAYTGLTTTIDGTPLTMAPGESGTMTVTLPASFTSGMTVEIMLHTTGGKDYPKVVTLP
jgi:archaeal type IV pilus assembly protein PilA